jgi:hypothetical protein
VDVASALSEVVIKGRRIWEPAASGMGPLVRGVVETIGSKERETGLESVIGPLLTRPSLIGVARVALLAAA